MASLLPDVAFPLFGSSTAALSDSLPLRLLHLGGCTLDARWGQGDYTAPHWRFYLNLDDGAEAIVRGRRTVFAAGALYAIPAWLHWVGRCRGLVRHLNALVDAPGLSPDQVRTWADRIFVLSPADGPLARAWAELGCQLAGCERPTSQHTATGHALVYQAFAMVFGQLTPRAQGALLAPGDRTMAEVLVWIERALPGAIPAAAIARQMGCSPAELVRRFRVHLGTSPARWVRQRRLTLAADLLRRSDTPIDLIAERCGFRERTQFSRAFAASMGCGPATWRRRQR